VWLGDRRPFGIVVGGVTKRGLGLGSEHPSDAPPDQPGHPVRHVRPDTPATLDGPAHAPANHSAHDGAGAPDLTDLIDQGLDHRYRDPGAGCRGELPDPRRLPAHRGDHTLLTSGKSVTVTGHPDPSLASFCQQGVILVVESVRLSG